MARADAPTKEPALESVTVLNLGKTSWSVECLVVDLDDEPLNRPVVAFIWHLDLTIRNADTLKLFVYCPFRLVMLPCALLFHIFILFDMQTLDDYHLKMMAIPQLIREGTFLSFNPLIRIPTRTTILLTK